jgi:hypothetical protein
MCIIKNKGRHKESIEYFPGPLRGFDTRGLHIQYMEFDPAFVYENWTLTQLDC